MTLEKLQVLFPRRGYNTALTGVIPMKFVNNHLEEIREICKTHKLRRIYRGPRLRNIRGEKDSFTHKALACGLMLYHR